MSVGVSDLILMDPTPKMRWGWLLIVLAVVVSLEQLIFSIWDLDTPWYVALLAGIPTWYLGDWFAVQHAVWINRRRVLAWSLEHPTVQCWFCWDDKYSYQNGKRTRMVLSDWAR